MDKEVYTINIGNLSIDYSSTSSSTITLDDLAISPIYTHDTINIDTQTDGNFIDWFEDQRIVNEYHEEKEIRERNEGVQAAWEQYQIMLALAKNPPENLD